MSSFLIVRPNTCENYNEITEYLNTTDHEFHTFCPSSSRQFKAIFRNLHHSTLIVNIINALNDLGHSVRHRKY